MIERRFVTADPAKCTGCSICELVCSLEKENVFDPKYSRIKATRLYGITNLAIACRMCEDAPCVRACPTKALTQNQESGVVLVDEEKCNACGWCLLACEYGAIAMHPDKKSVLICDLCEGEPKCLEWCPEDALDLLTETEVNHMFRLVTAEKLVLNI